MYRRFIAYLYEYHGKTKKENRGYVKVEARNGSCAMEIHMRCPGLAPEQNCRIYGFVRNPDGLAGVKLGGCVTAPGRLDCRLVSRVDRLNESPVSLDDLSGMILLTDGGGFYGTQWDDEPISPEAFREPGEAEPVKEPEEAEPEERSEPAEEPEPERDLEPENEPEPERDLEPAEGPEREEEPKPEEEPEPELEKTSELEEELELAEEPEPERNLEPENEPEPAEEPELEKASVLEEEPEPEEEPAPAEAAEAPAEKTPEPFWPFADGEITDCRKMTPAEFRFFPQRVWPLRNNRFLLHGYRQFGHLLLGRLRGSGQYVLGVPGIYEQQEQMMAGIFGFPHFKSSRAPECPGTQGCRTGYWYRLVDAPDPHM